MPVAVEADDPFVTLPQAPTVFTPHTPPQIHSGTHAPQPGSTESFPSPEYVASTPGDTPLQMRTQGPAHGGNLNHNRSSPHSPSGNKSGNKARDVWEFYEEAGGFNYCKFCQYSLEAFVDAITKWIIQDNQLLNAIEHSKLHEIFLMLRVELKDSDIPHWNTICNQIMEVWDEHLDNLQDEMENALGKFSMTTDLWTDPNLTPFITVTVHWIGTTTVQTI
ncbi:hypothetical protein BDQ17DRAFT_1425254 [Cyathus striatus]|nr:hypothetical protein BDQ17DRAFT_1425254 [Cyathus striatus]